MLNRSDIAGYTQIALEQARVGMRVRARKIMEAVVEGAPGDLTALNVLGTLRYEDGDIDGAKLVLERILAAQPRSPLASLLLGEIAIRANDWAGAAKQLEISSACEIEAIRLRAGILLAARASATQSR